MYPVAMDFSKSGFARTTMGPSVIVLFQDHRTGQDVNGFIDGGICAITYKPLNIVVLKV
jgi:hypothetical protein